jgi:hypothetical protein
MSDVASDKRCWQAVAFKAHLTIIHLRRQIETLQTPVKSSLVEEPKEPSVEKPIKTVFNYIKQPFVVIPLELLNAVHNSMTPLHLACMSNNPSAVQWLINAGANVDLATCDGFTALHWAAMRGHVCCLELLLKANAFADPLSITEWTPLSRAVWRRSFATKAKGDDEYDRLTECMMLLLTYGAQIRLVKSAFRPDKAKVESLAFLKQSNDPVSDWLQAECELFLN